MKTTSNTVTSSWKEDVAAWQEAERRGVRDRLIAGLIAALMAIIWAVTPANALDNSQGTLGPGRPVTQVQAYATTQAPTQAKKPATATTVEVQTGAGHQLRVHLSARNPR